MMDTPAFAARSFARPALHAAVLYISIIMISMMTMAKPAHASGTVVQSAPLWCTNSSYPSTCIYPTKEAVCIALIGNRTDYYFGFLYYYPGGEAVGWTCWAYATLHPGDAAYAQRFGWLASMAVCPANSTGTTSCTCTDPYVPDEPLHTSCVLPACPDHASRNPPGAACTCDVNYKFDAAGTSCVPACPIPPLPELLATDLCTLSLEKGKGKDVDLACGPLDPEMVIQAQCLADKIHRLAIPYTEPSATVRTEAYQQHFVDIWKWKEKIRLEQKYWSDAEKQACAPTVAKVKAEMGKHGITGEPSNSGSDAPHVLRKAVDIDEAVVDAMDEKVSETTFVMPVNCFLFCMPIPVYIGDVQDYVNSPLVNPPPCKLRWGGRFKDQYGNDNPDPVHFDLFLK